MAEEEKTAPHPEVQYIPPERGLPSVYANNVAVAPSNSDVRLIFGLLTEATTERVVIYTKVEVITSWVEAKILASFLQAHVDAFEKKNGPIRFPETPDSPIMKNPFDTTAEAVMASVDAIKR